jgi:hypothetical protein
VKHLRVRSVVELPAIRVEEVQPPVLHCGFSPVTQEIMYACAHRDIKLEVSGEITTVSVND